jgi:hypothetical protein
LAAGTANIINCFVGPDVDALMRRTRVLPRPHRLVRRHRRLASGACCSWWCSSGPPALLCPRLALPRRPRPGGDPDASGRRPGRPHRHRGQSYRDLQRGDGGRQPAPGPASRRGPRRGLRRGCAGTERGALLVEASRLAAGTGEGKTRVRCARSTPPPATWPCVAWLLRCFRSSDDRTPGGQPARRGRAAGGGGRPGPDGRLVSRVGRTVPRKVPRERSGTRE